MSSAPRLPSVAGIFYPERKEPLKELLDHLLPASPKKQKAIAAVVPHGSLYTSGEVAGAVYGSLQPAKTAVILGPNHSRLGERLSIPSNEEWTTPLGSVATDKELARLFMKSVPELKRDSKAHQHEHAAELQLLFLQRLWKLKSFLPVAFSGMDDEAARQVGEGIARGLKKAGKDTLLIATAHLTRYELQEKAERVDRRLIDRIIALDGEGLMREVAETEGSMCGAPAVAAAIAAAKELGGSRATLVKYNQGYAGILIQ